MINESTLLVVLQLRHPKVQLKSLVLHCSNSVKEKNCMLGLDVALSENDNLVKIRKARDKMRGS